MIRLEEHYDPPDGEEELLRERLHLEEKKQREAEALKVQRSQEADARSKILDAEISTQVVHVQHDTCAVPSQMRFKISDGGNSSGLDAEQSVPKFSQRRVSRRSTSGTLPCQRSRPQTSATEAETFQPLQARQPLMFEAMKLAPGVSIFESGRTRMSPQSRGSTQMTRKEFIMQSNITSAGASSSNFGESQYPTASSLSSSASISAEVGAPSSSQDPIMPKQSLPAVPGFRYSHSMPWSTARERGPIRGVFHSSRQCGAPPPVGATMGHGLVSQHGGGPKVLSKEGNSSNVVLARSNQGRGSKHLSGSESSGAVNGGGKIVANHDLLHRLFSSKESLT